MGRIYYTLSNVYILDVLVKVSERIANENADNYRLRQSFDASPRGIPEN